MKTLFATITVLAIACNCLAQTADVRNAIAIETDILKAEDARDFNRFLENSLKSGKPGLRIRAALAAGRIGDEKAVPALIEMLEKDAQVENRAMAAFAIGEIESVKGAEAILKVLSDTKASASVRARAVEAAGKIAAANSKDPKAAELGKAIIATMEFEVGRRSAPNHEVILMGVTAIIRARPEGGETTAAKFLDYSDARIRADALNTLARLRAKNVNVKARELLVKDTDPIVRANAARVLGAAEDKEAADLLVNAATKDVDSRVRVSAIRALGNLKDPNIVEKLLVNRRAVMLDLVKYLVAKDKFKKTFRKNSFSPADKNIKLEMAAMIGRIMPNYYDELALTFLGLFREADNYSSPETEIAFAKIAPEKYLADFATINDGTKDWRVASAYAQGLAELANSKDQKLKDEAQLVLNHLIASVDMRVKQSKVKDTKMVLAYPDFLRAVAAFKPNDLSENLRKAIKHDDVFVRATAAELIAEQPSTQENIKALNEAFSYSFVADKHDNDAVLGIMDALYKLDKKAAVGSFLVAINSPDYLVRKKASDLLKDEQLQKDFPGIPTSLEIARVKNKDKVLPYTPIFGTKLGQVLNTDADYRRALSRKNGQVRAVVKTVKGDFTIEFFPEDAPLTVDNFIKLANSGYFNGKAVHRVVPNFVMQDGDPLGNGSGGPGWSIRCEVNMLSYERGMVGMALSGKDTGGSQWFVTHSPQPHLDGGYTIFGKVNETGMKIVDSIARGDTILSIKVTGDLPRRKR